MAIILILIYFVSVFLMLGVFSGRNAGKKELLLESVLLFSAAVVVITEFLSLLHLLNFWGILVSWAVITLFNVIYLYQKRFKLAMFYYGFKQKLISALTGLKTYEKIILAASLLMLVLVFIQGIIYPPNNWDSMTYHLARIPNWISHHSVEHYPTSIVRQIYQPPFAEYVVMSFNILNRSDYFSASVQFLFLLSSIVAILYIVQIFGLGRSFQVIAIGLTLSIPEVLLQASSTQNDIVVSFFIISACIFAFKAIKEPLLKNFLFLGLAIGIGILTKGTAYIYLAPVILVFAIAVTVQLYKTKKLLYLTYPITVVLLIIAINFGFYGRNYNLYHNVLGVDKAESQMYANQKMSPMLLLSSMIKNAGLHCGAIYCNFISTGADKIIYELHQLTGIDINDPAVNYREMKYDTVLFTTHEDTAPNLFHLLLISISSVMMFICIIKKRGTLAAKLLFLILIMQVLLFCGYLKWQPWNTRLHVPVFLLFMPLLVYVASRKNGFKKAVYIVMPLAFTFSFFTVLHNATRPLGKAVFNDRYKNIFFSKPGTTYTEYNGITEAVKKLNYKNIGLLLDNNDWEYPLFTDSYSHELNPIHINVANATANTKVKLNNVDCIISTLVNKAYIDYKGRRFYNRSIGNKVIYMYDTSLQ